MVSGMCLTLLACGKNETIQIVESAIDNDGKVVAIDILYCMETAGIGLIVASDTSDGENFRSQFIGSNKFVALIKDDGTIDGITGATVTSRAICDGINAALECVGNLK